MLKKIKPMRKLLALSLALTSNQLTLVNVSIADDETQGQILNELQDQSFMMRHNQINRDLDEMKQRRESQTQDILDSLHERELNSQREDNIRERVRLLNEGADASILDQ